MNPLSRRVVETIFATAHRFSFVLIAVSTWSLAVVAAQESRGFGETDKLAIEQMFDRYVEAFVQKDYPKLLEFVEAPFLVMQGDLRSLNSTDAVLAFYREIRQNLDQRGFDHGDIVGKRIIPLAADRALLNTAYRRYNKNGSLLEERASIYLVTKSSGTWKLRSVVNQDLQYFGKVY